MPAAPASVAAPARGAVIVPPAPAAAASDFAAPEHITISEAPEPTTQPQVAKLAPFVAPTVATAPEAAVPIRQAPIPETGAVQQIDAQQAAALQKLVEALSTSDYFETLQIPQTATTAQIKKAFYRESRIYHPDRIYHLADEAAKRQLGDLYKRITEAYYVLRDDAKRKKYLTEINGADRASKLRFSEASEAEQKAEVIKQREEEFGTNPKARQFFKTALNDISSSNLSAAERNIKMALTYEPSNARFKEKMAEVQAKLEEHRKATHTGFTIK